MPNIVRYNSDPWELTTNPISISWLCFLREKGTRTLVRSKRIETNVYNVFLIFKCFSEELSDWWPKFKMFGFSYHKDTNNKGHGNHWRTIYLSHLHHQREELGEKFWMDCSNLSPHWKTIQTSRWIISFPCLKASYLFLSYPGFLDFSSFFCQKIK